MLLLLDIFQIGFNMFEIAVLHASSGDQIYLAAKYGFQFVGKPEEIHAHRLSELHHDVHVTVGSVVAPADRAENSHAFQRVFAEKVVAFGGECGGYSREGGHGCFYIILCFDLELFREKPCGWFVTRQRLAPAGRYLKPIGLAALLGVVTKRTVE